MSSFPLLEMRIEDLVSAMALDRAFILADNRCCSECGMPATGYMDNQNGSYLDPIYRCDKHPKPADVYGHPFTNAAGIRRLMRSVRRG